MWSVRGHGRDYNVHNSTTTYYHYIFYERNRNVVGIILRESSSWKINANSNHVHTKNPSTTRSVYMRRVHNTSQHNRGYDDDTIYCNTAIIIISGDALLRDDVNYTKM